MTAYNRLNGTYCNENEHLLRDILRGDWGFDGSSSPTGAATTTASPPCAPDRRSKCRPPTARPTGIVEAVQNGTLDEALLDEQVDHVLDFIFTAQKALACGGVFDGTAHHALAAAKAAAESAVPLKNEKEFLPPRQGERVAVIGDFAAVPRYQGAGGSRVNPTVDAPLDARAAGVDVTGYERAFSRSGAARRGRVRAGRSPREAIRCLLLPRSGRGARNGRIRPRAYAPARKPARPSARDRGGQSGTSASCCSAAARWR